MKRMIVGILAAQILGIAGAVAGPWEDGTAAYNRGDYCFGRSPNRAMRRPKTCSA